MKLRNKTILLISPEIWNHIFVSKHHYAVHLGKRDNKVFFLNPPSATESVAGTEYENVFSVTYKGFPRGLRFYPPFLQRYFIRRKFEELQKLCGVKFNIVWSFDNSVFFDFKALPKQLLKISHIVDLNQNFQIGKAAETANICFCTTELIKNRLIKFNPLVYKINHGFNKNVLDVKSALLPGKSSIKVLYAGNLAMPYIDWMLIHTIVKDNPAIDFIFVGPNKEINNNKSKAKQEVMKAENTFLTGRVKADELLTYYKLSDILIVAYQERYHADQANPHKMMEYLGSGKMIVTTFTAEYAELSDQHLLLMSHSNSEFSFKFRQAVSDLKYWNDKEKQEFRKKLAIDNTYEKQIDRIESFIVNRGDLND